MENIDVSVYMLTYFHENTIRKAIDSVLSQDTNYSFEIVVSDDHSTDNTPNILDEYATKYPDIIRVNKNKNNLGIPKNILIARTMCRGKYIVSLSGDDYWIDKFKLEKQVSFLENNKDYFGVCVRMELRYDNDYVPFSILPKSTECEKEFTLKDYEKGKTLYTHGLMIRNPFLKNEGIEYFMKAQEISDKVDDAVDNVLMLRLGKFFVLNEITDVYRVPSNKKEKRNYNSRYDSFEKSKQSIELYNNLFKHFGNEIDFKEKFKRNLSIIILRGLLDKDKKRYVKLYQTIPYEYRIPFYKSILIPSFFMSIKFCIDRFINTILSKRRFK